MIERVTDPAWQAVSKAYFVSLTTFRRSGVPVSSAVWIAPLGEELLITTMLDTGKVKRIRNGGRVELRPCDRRGTVAPDAVVAHGVARVLTDDAARARLYRALRRKYRIGGTTAWLVGTLSRRARARRAVVSILPATKQ